MRRPVTKSKSTPAKAAAPVAVRLCCPGWLVAVLLGLVTLVLYWPATRHDFVNYDDNLYVTENTHVQAGVSWENVKWAFNNPVDDNWHPLTLLSHMLDCQLYGLKPWGHHLTSILLHATNTALVFLLLRGLTGAFWRSAMVAALFGLHPVHVESVAWVAERKDVLSAFFGLLVLIFYARYVQSKIRNPKSAIGNYLLSLFFLALGLMSKPMLVTWPFVMLLLDYWPLGRFKAGNVWWLMREKIPFFVLVAVASVVTFIVQKQGGAMVTGEILPLGARTGNALVSYYRYLGKLFWPRKLAVFYPYPGHWPVGGVLLAAGLLVGLSVLLFAQRRRYPFLQMGWLWYLGTLVPVIGLVQVGDQAMADRYSYIPSLGVLIALTWGVYELSRCWRHHVIVLSVAGLAAVILCMAMSREQLGYWQDSETLYRHALDVTENNYLAHNNLGNTFYEKGRIDEAIGQFREAIRLNPNDARAYNNLGYALLKEGEIDEAIRRYREAIRLKPDFTEAHSNLGYALYMKGQIDEAISQYRKTIRLKPDNAKAHYNLGVVLSGVAKLDEAISQYQEALRLQPDDADIHNILGIALGRKDQIDEAIDQFQEAIRLKPDDTNARTNLVHALEIKNTPAGR